MPVGVYSIKKRKGLFQKGHKPYYGNKGNHYKLSNETKEKMKGRIPWNKGKIGVYILSKKTRKKISNALSGEKSYLWKGGITPENKKIRNSIGIRFWRELVFARDNWTCQKTGVKGGVLCSHHILNFAQYPELRFAIDNGITFSKQAHKEFHKIYGRKNNTKEQLIKFLNI